MTDKSAGVLYTSLSTRGTRHVQHRIWRGAAWVIRRARVSLNILARRGPTSAAVRLQVCMHARLACETSRVGGMRARRVRVVVGVPDASDMGDA